MQHALKYEQSEKPIAQDAEPFIERAHGRPSCLDRFNEGPNCGLTLPTIENLVLFGSGERTERRRPNPGGFKLGNNFYVPYRQNPELDLALANEVDKAKDDKELKIPLRICTIGEFTFVFFSLDNERTWELAIDKDRGDPTWLSHTDRMKGAEAWVTQKGNEAALFFQTLLSAREQPIVLNGLRRRHRFETLEQAKGDLEALKQSPDYQVTPRELSEILAVAPESSTDAPVQPAQSTGVPEQTAQPTVPTATPKTRKSRGRTKPSSTSVVPANNQSSPEQPQSSVPLSEPPLNTPTDNDEFLRELNRRLGLG